MKKEDPVESSYRVLGGSCFSFWVTGLPPLPLRSTSKVPRERKVPGGRVTSSVLSDGKQDIGLDPTHQSDILN